MTEGDKAFWYLRRVLGFRDEDQRSDVDAAIREELELNSLAGGRVSLYNIRSRLGLMRGWKND